MDEPDYSKIKILLLLNKGRNQNWPVRVMCVHNFRETLAFFAYVFSVIRSFSNANSKASTRPKFT